MTDSVKIGVVGAGVFGSFHAAKFAAQDNAILAGIFDIDAERAAALADQFGSRAYARFGSLLDNVDGVVIATPATRHFALALEAIDNSRHLLVEKPLAITTDEADALIARARDRDVVLQVGHQERYVCEAAGVLAQVETPIRIECVRRVPYTGRCEDVTVAFDLMVHDIDIVQQLTKASITNARAHGSADEISAEILLDNGAVVALNACRRAEAPERRMTVVYRDGIVEFDYIKRTLGGRGGSTDIDSIGGDAPPLALSDPLAHGAGLFLAAVQGRTNAIVTGEDGRACVQWAEQIEHAAGIGVNAAPHRERMRA